MLYERWRQVAQDFRNEIALHDVASGDSWTFAQLAKVAESCDPPSESMVFPEGISPEFLFSVLQGWRFQKTVCPLEPEQTPPSLPKLPADFVHIKAISARTGTARVIAFKAEQLCADANNIVETLKLRRNEPNLGIISLAHSYGFSNLVLPLLLHGIPLALANSTTPETLRRASKKFESITLPATPSLWRYWLEENAIPKNVRLAISAGSLLPLALEKEIFETTGIKVHNFYSSSECGGIAYDQSETPRKDSRFVGTPVKNVQLKVNANGCLEIHSMAVGETYWPEGSDALANGCFQSNDLGELKKDKVLLAGRATELIHVNGRKVSPEMIETALLAHPDVADSLVFGIPGEDPKRGETIVACVSVYGRTTTEVLKQFLLTKLAAWKVPREWWLVDSLQTGDREQRTRNEWRQNYLRNKSAGDTRFWVR